MSTYKNDSKPAFVFKNPGVHELELNPFLQALCSVKRAPSWIHLMYTCSVYPKAVLRMDFFKSQPNEPSAWIFKPPTGRAETPGDVEGWAIQTAWALGSEMIMHHHLAPTDKSDDFRRKDLAMMHLAKITRPQSGEGHIGKDCIQEENEAKEKGCWVWSFNTPGTHWNELPQARRFELLRDDQALQKRKDGFRSLPIPPMVIGRILSFQHVYITFAEAQSFTGSRFTPKAVMETGDPFLGG